MQKSHISIILMFLSVIFAPYKHFANIEFPYFDVANMAVKIVKIRIYFHIFIRHICAIKIWKYEKIRFWKIFNKFGIWFKPNRAFMGKMLFAKVWGRTVCKSGKSIAMSEKKSAENSMAPSLSKVYENDGFRTCRGL